MKWKCIALITIVGAFLCIPKTYALNQITVDLQVSSPFTWYQVAIPSASPINIVQVNVAIGGGVSLDVVDFFSFSPSLDIFWDEKRYSNRYNTEVPSNSGQFGMLTEPVVYMSFLLSLPLILYIPVLDQVALGFGVSPSVILQVPMATNSSSELLTAHHYSDGRFFYPEVQTRLAFEFQDINMQVMGRLFLPIYHLWDNSATSFLHEMIVLFTLQVRFPVASFPDSVDEL